MEKIEIFCTTRINNSQILVKAVDGDGVILKNIFDNSEEEIRFFWYRCSGNKTVP